MKYVIDFNKHTPAYQQLYLLIREDIVHGIYPKGSKLPSKRVLALDCNVSTITNEHAYTLLCEEGYIEAKPRSGYYVIFHVDDGFAKVANEFSEQPLKMIPHDDLSCEFPFSTLAKTMRKVISDAQESMLQRSFTLGTYELRKAIAMYLARNRRIVVDLDQIVIGSGSEQLYTLIVQVLGRNKVYAIESPCYKKIEQIYHASDVVLEKLALSHDGIDSKVLKASKADVLHISPYRSYPSGVSASASKRHEYLNWSKSNDRYIIEDDFESEFSVSKKSEETLFSHAVNDNVIYMNSFSKTLSPSFRVAYMVLPKKLITTYQEKLGFFSCTVPTYIQLVLSELINNGDFERHINRVRRMKRKQKMSS